MEERNGRRAGDKDKIVAVEGDPLERPTIKAALFLGFSLIFGIWLFAGYFFTRFSEKVNSPLSTCPSSPAVCQLAV